MNAPWSTPPQVRARLAGLCYAITIAAGLFAEVGVRSAFRGGEALPIAENVAFYRAGELADVVMLCAYLCVTTLLYDLFASGGRQLSRLAAAFSLTGIATLASNGILHMAPLALVEQTGPGNLCASGCDAAIAMLLDLHGSVYGISLIFFGIYCLLVGWLAIRSCAVPSAVGILMMLGGASHLVTKAAAVVDPDLAFPKLLSILPLIGEAMLALWLLVFGIRSGTVKTA